MTILQKSLISISGLIEPKGGWPVLDAKDELLRSIAAAGRIGVPIAVEREDNKWRVIDGQRRVAAALALGLDVVPAFEHETNGDTLLDGVVFNVVRRPGRRSERIRLMRQLMLRTPANVAAGLGVDEQQARRLLRMIGLDDSVLEVLEACEMAAERGENVQLPSDADLCAIAAAPVGLQQSAIHMCSDAEDRSNVDWWEMENRCTSRRISRRHALFDVEQHDVRFIEDLFAQPDDEDRFTTDDAEGFIACQRQALEALLAKKKPKTSWHVAAWNGAGQSPVIPENMGASAIIYDLQDATVTKGEHIYATVAESGPRLGQVVAWRVYAKAGKVEAEMPDAPEEEVEEEGDDAPAAIEPAPQPEADILPITKTGRELVAKRKQEALHVTLQNLKEPHNWRRIVVWLCLAMRADNVSAGGNRHVFTGSPDKEASQLVDAAGHVIIPPDDVLATIAGETLARALRMDMPEMNTYNRGSGPVAEWIGHSAGADANLPRFDDADFLEQVKGDALRAAAASADLSGLPKPVKDLRARLRGALPSWVPPGASFGAAGPMPPTADGSADDGMEDAA